MSNYYDYFKAFHIIFVICWMAGIFYLPRLFVYHAKASAGSELDKTLQIMEKKLLKIIMNPSMILTISFGMINAYIYGLEALGVWFIIKMLAVFFLLIFHKLLAKWRKDFAEGRNQHSERFYRMINEIPVILMIIAVLMVVLKPFE